MERIRSYTLTCRLACRFVSLVFIGMLGIACGTGNGSFTGLIAHIDASPETARIDMYIKAAELADSTESRLRILKRAAHKDSHTYAETARAMLDKGAVSGPVLMAIIDALIEDGALLQALSLFEGMTDPGGFEAVYAELAVRCLKAGYSPSIPMEKAVMCADVTGDIRWMLNAAIDAMVLGDKGTAALLLDDAEKKGFSMPYRVLWDVGMYSVLADRLPQSDDPLEIAVCADSAYMLGREASAAYLYASILERFPDWSWKPYAALARQSAEPGSITVAKWPHIPLDGSLDLLTSPSAMVERHYRILEDKFPNNTGALVERARWLYGQGRIAEASALLAREDSQSAAARLRMAPLDRIVPLAYHYVATYPESAEIVDVSLEMLASIGAWTDFRKMLDVLHGGGKNAPRMWLWQALLKALDGDAAGAAAEIRMHGPQHASYAGIFDLAILELAADNPAKAREAAIIAIGSAKNDEEKSSAFILLGDTEISLGKLKEARQAYNAALDSYPESRPARSRLQRLALP